MGGGIKKSRRRERREGRGTRKRMEKGKTVNRCQSTVVPEWSNEMAFGFPAASVAAAAPRLSTYATRGCTRVCTWKQSRRFTIFFFFSFCPRVNRISACVSAMARTVFEATCTCTVARLAPLNSCRSFPVTRRWSRWNRSFLLDQPGF